MAGPSTKELSLRAIMALTLKHFGSPASLESLMVFANGQLAQWPGWKHLPIEDQQTIARQFCLRQDSLANRWMLQDSVRIELNKAEIFAQVPGDPDLFTQTAGKDLDQIIEESLDKLARRKRQTSRVQGIDSGHASVIHITASKTEYAIPAAEIKEPADPVQLDPPAACPHIEIPISELLDLARRIDARADHPFSYHDVLSSFLDSLHDETSHAPVSRSISLTHGPLGLCIAPTGGGKSILIHVMALLLAGKGIPVSVILPQVKDVVEKNFILENHIQRLGLDITVAPINSPHSILGKTAEFLDRPLPEDSDCRWVLNHFGYFCPLRAYRADGPEEEEFDLGKEPCRRLSYQKNTSSKSQRVDCPFLRTCPKYRIFTKALHADILLVNHSALSTGRIFPTMLDHREEPVTSVMQLVMNRTPVVLIDEIDAFQNTAVNMGAKGLELSCGGHQPPLMNLTQEFREKQIREQDPATPSMSQIRSCLLTIEDAAFHLTDMIDRQEIDWQKNVRKICYSRTFDRDIADALWQDHTRESIDRLNQLVCPRTPGTTPALPGSREHALYSNALQWLSPPPADLSTPSQRKSDLVTTLQEEFAITPSRETQLVADRLIIKILLHTMESKLSFLRSSIARLDTYGLTKAADIRDRLQGFMPWLASPLGPLQKRVWGFQASGSDREKHTLTAHCIAGDPHGYVLGLGDESALALTGLKRCVMGFSATAKFHGSTVADIQASAALYQRDDDQKIRIHQVLVHDGDTPIRISGIAAPAKRDREIQKMATGIWDQFLEQHITSLRKHMPERSKILLITGSYKEAAIVGQALQGIIDQTSRRAYGVYTVAREPKNRNSREIKPFQIESFPHYPDGDILVAPLEVISRGYNIIQPGSHTSALASIFILVRPVPPIADTIATSAYVSYCNQLLTPTQDVSANIKTAHSHALANLWNIQNHCTVFSRVPKELRFHIYCNILVKIIQLAGRARRGGTSVDLYLVDAAFSDERVGWKQLTALALDTWNKEGKTPQMNQLYGGLIKALQTFASSR